MLAIAAFSAMLAIVAVVGMIVDDRTLGGAHVWAKPLKFGISGAVYGLTWAWMCSLIDRRYKTVRRASMVVAVLLGVELIVIFSQAARGKRSHYNFDSLFDAVLYEIMATSIFTVWIGALVLTLLVLRSNIRNRADKLTVGFGSVISLVGVGLGALMTLPTADQITIIGSGHGFDTIGAHTVGSTDGGPGIPFLGWSTTGGDLRIPHFVGMHALQAVLLWNLALGLLAGRFSWLRSTTVRARLVIVGGMGYAGLLTLLTWQAYRGQALIAPDAWTLAALGVLVAGMIAGTIFTLRRAAMSTVDSEYDLLLANANESRYALSRSRD